MQSLHRAPVSTPPQNHQPTVLSVKSPWTQDARIQPTPQSMIRGALLGFWLAPLAASPSVRDGGIVDMGCRDIPRPVMAGWQALQMVSQTSPQPYSKFIHSLDEASRAHLWCWLPLLLRHVDNPAALCDRLLTIPGCSPPMFAQAMFVASLLSEHLVRPAVVVGDMVHRWKSAMASLSLSRTYWQACLQLQSALVSGLPTIDFSHSAGDLPGKVDDDDVSASSIHRGLIDGLYCLDTACVGGIISFEGALLAAQPQTPQTLWYAGLLAGAIAGPQNIPLLRHLQAERQSLFPGRAQTLSVADHIIARWQGQSSVAT